ncbi:MAG: DUF4124 domain-containing protein [Arenimonas sp.]
MTLAYRHFCLILIGLLTSLQASAAMAATPVEPGKVTVYRCIDTKGKVSLQDSPCAKTSQQETREMIRPKDAPPSKKIYVRPAPMPAPQPVQESYSYAPPPPTLYQCTNYEGKVRDSENYDPNPRCEPLWVLGYHEEYLPFEQRGKVCRWIEDSCVRYEGRALCDRWKEKKKQAESDVRYAFSDTQAYRKSELARITQIVRNSCQ